MDWRDVSGQLLKRPSALDNLLIHPYGEPTPTRMPALVKVTLGLLDQAMKSGHNRLIVVYPDKQQLTFMTVIFQAVNDVISGTLATKYDIFSFQKGQRLKVLNLVCEFDRIETDPKDHIKRIFVRFSDSLCGYPIEKAPFFQLTDTNRPLSKTPSFKEIMRKTTYDSVVDQLAGYKTYMPDTVYYISSVGNTKNLMTESLIDGEQISEVILLGQTTREGEIHTIGKGQLTGIPAVTLATDLYSVNVSAKNGAPARIIFIDGTNENLIDTQLDAIDPLLYSNIPVICLTDSAHSFDMKSLEDRDFLSLRWDENSIVPDLCCGQQTTVIRKISNCANRKIEYILCNNQEITETHKLLNKFRACQQDYSAIMQEAFWQIFRIAFYVLRNTLQLPDEALERYRQEIDRLESVVATQNRFLAPAEIGGYFAFYRLSRKLITATGIISGQTETIKEKRPYDLEPGDFVVVREAEKNIIRELADEILKAEGNAHLRSLSGRWKEPLEKKRLLFSIQELYDQLAKEGCTIGYQAFRNWVEDDDRIGPRNKEDFLYIAAALGDNYLIENIDKIYEACRVVRNAHQDAGKVLSKRLKSQIANTIGNFDTINPMNFWDPIVLQLEDIGTVRILKVTEIGSPVTVDAINTNRLLTE